MTLRKRHDETERHYKRRIETTRKLQAEVALKRIGDGTDAIADKLREILEIVRPDHA